MLKATSLTLAIVIGIMAAIPSSAAAGDTGPCDHCTMEPIIVIGERPKKKKVQTSTQQLQTAQPTSSAGKKRR